MATIYLKNNLKPDALNILLQGMEAHPKSIVLVSLAIRLISGDEKLKSQNEARLAQLIDKYKSLKEMELKNLENLPLLIEESSPVGKEGLMSF
jgi:hypothetical protein